jgi:acetyl-CoA carboxylase carboxyl transferase subunit beta
MVVHRHDMRPTLARLCRLLTKSPAVEVAAPKAEAIVDAQIVPAAESAPAAPHA